MKQNNITQVILSKEVYKGLLRDVYERRQIEACGLLLGTTNGDGNWHIEQMHAMSNIFSSPVYFEFAPEELLDAELRYPGQIVGVYHSHPTGYPSPSETDRQNMQRVNQEQQIPWVWLIVCGPFPTHIEHLYQHPPLILAYHHYEQAGLQQLSVHTESL